MHIDTSYSAEKLVREIFLSDSVKIFNVKYRGSKSSLAYFHNDSSNLAIKDGIILSTGRAMMVNGPNDKRNSGTSVFGMGDDDLARVIYGETYDATALEFDFVPEQDSISFNFIFGSEEYPEYVGSRFNDVFAFFLSGPGIKIKRNIAMIPNTFLPVAINNLNYKKNQQYYVDNNFFFDKKGELKKKYLKPKYQDAYKRSLQYDGYTTLLPAQANVIPFRTYHIKIVIADVGDHVYDSGVFLEGGSFRSRKAKMKPVDIDYVEAKRSLDNELRSISHEQVFATITLHINFDFDKSIIPDSSYNDLNTLCTLMKQRPNLHVEIYGHTDNYGTAEYNLPLSAHRAEAVAAYMINHGISSSRICTEGKGLSEPVTENTTSEGRAQNRRVVFVIKE
jgi:outer membrane protein OmpA-like peptidoglycan-associated protein